MKIMDLANKKSSDEAYKAVCDVIDKHDVKSICDYGCGDGQLVTRLVEKYGKKITCLGIDQWSQDTTNTPPQPIDKSLRFIDTHKEGHNKIKEEFADTFDLVISTFTLHHFERPISELKFIESLSKQSGHIMIVDMVTKFEDKYLPTNTLWAHGQLFLALKGQYHRMPYTIEETCDLLQVCNAQIVEKTIFSSGLSAKEQQMFSDYFLDTSIVLIEKVKREKPDSKTHEMLKDIFIDQKELHVKILQKYPRIDNDLMKIVLKKTPV